MRSLRAQSRRLAHACVNEEHHQSYELARLSKDVKFEQSIKPLPEFLLLCEPDGGNK